MLPLVASKNFVALAEQYRDLSIAFPALKGITLAQWAMESGWGKTKLAQVHQNYAGMKWGRVDELFGSAVMYGGAKYTAFTSPTMFIEGYWNRVLNTAPFNDWHGHMDSAEMFITWITPMWLTGRHLHDSYLLPAERKYIKEVLDIRNRRTEEFFLCAHEGEDQHA